VHEEAENGDGIRNPACQASIALQFVGTPAWKPLPKTAIVCPLTPEVGFRTILGTTENGVKSAES
jgi:hypothetical protein